MKIEIDNVYNIDCMIGMTYMREQNIVADMLLTDIPYGVVSRRGNGLRNLDKSFADIVTFDLEAYLESVDSVVNGVFIIFCGTEQVSAIREFFVNKGYTTRLIIWEKTNPSPMNGKKVYLSGVECAIYAKKRGRGVFNGFCKNTVFRYPTVRNRIHHTQKPLKLWKELVLDNTAENQLVLDSCMGSFTTAIACRELQRRYIGFELNREYFDLGMMRLKDNK